MLNLTAEQAYLALFIAVLPICAWVCWSDLKTMKIPNNAVLATIAVFAVVGFVVFPPLDWLWRWPNLSRTVSLRAVANL